MKRLLLIASLLILFVPAVTQAASAPARERGLLITPLRQYLQADAGGSALSAQMLLCCFLGECSLTRLAADAGGRSLGVGAVIFSVR